jgi:hypothetical protein
VIVAPVVDVVVIIAVFDGVVVETAETAGLDA